MRRVSSKQSKETPSQRKSKIVAPRSGSSSDKISGASVRIIGSPDLIFPATTKELKSGESVSSENSSVFERLYQQGKNKVASARVREFDASSSHRSQSLKSPSASSIGGTTISTLSSTETAFDRLRKGEKRNYSPLWNDHFATSSPLERRLSYAPPGKRNRIRTTAPRASIANEQRSTSTMSTGASSVFDRLYRKEKRTTSSLLEIVNGRKSSVQTPTRPRSLSKTTTDSASATPNIRGRRERKLDQLCIEEDCILESVANFSAREHSDDSSPQVDASAFDDEDLVQQFHLGDVFATEFNS